MAESERYLPELVDVLDEVVERAGLRHDDIWCTRAIARSPVFAKRAGVSFTRPFWMNSV